MPIYDYNCPSCGVQEDIWAGVDQEEVPCPKCGIHMDRLLSATRSNPDWEPYYDENLCKLGSAEGHYVKSRQHRKELMKAHGLVDRWSGT